MVHGQGQYMLFFQPVRAHLHTQKILKLQVGVTLRYHRTEVTDSFVSGVNKTVNHRVKDCGLILFKNNVDADNAKAELFTRGNYLPFPLSLASFHPSIIKDNNKRPPTRTESNTHIKSFMTPILL